MNVITNAFELCKEFVGGHSITQGLGRAFLYGRSIGKRIGKRESQFDHIHTCFLQLLQYCYRVLKLGKARCEVDGQ